MSSIFMNDDATTLLSTSSLSSSPQSPTPSSSLLQYTLELEQSKRETLQQFDGLAQRIECDTIRSNYDMNQREVKLNKLQRRLIKFTQELIQHENNVKAQEELIIYAKQAKQKQEEEEEAKKQAEDAASKALALKAERQKQLDIDFTKNKSNTSAQQSSLHIKFDLLPLQKVCSCGHTGWGGVPIFGCLYTSLFARFFRADHNVGRTPTKTSHHKVFVASKDVLNGDWVQICGDGAEIDSNTLPIFQLFDYNTRHVDQYADDQSDRNYGNQPYNYTLQIKWE